MSGTPDVNWSAPLAVVALDELLARVRVLEQQVASLQLARPRGLAAMKAIELRAMLAQVPMVCARLAGVRDFDLAREVARVASEHLADSCSDEERAWWSRLREVAT